MGKDHQQSCNLGILLIVVGACSLLPAVAVSFCLWRKSKHGLKPKTSKVASELAESNINAVKSEAAESEKECWETASASTGLPMSESGESPTSNCRLSNEECESESSIPVIVVAVPWSAQDEGSSVI